MNKIIELEQDIYVKVSLEQAGRDRQVLISGGDLPHIGSIAVAVPRESLLKDGSMSATVSVINVTGHKDDRIGVKVAEKLAAFYNCIVTVSCGIHIEKITELQMTALLGAEDRLVQEIILMEKEMSVEKKYGNERIVKQEEAANDDSK